MIAQYTDRGFHYHALHQYDLAAIQFGLALRLNRQDVQIYFHRDQSAEALHAYSTAHAALKNEALRRLQPFLKPL